jgi:hypothetical protein
VPVVVGAAVLNGDWWTSSDSHAGWSGCSSEGTGDSLQVSFKSRQGRWHIAKTIASGVGMTNEGISYSRCHELEDSMGRACSSAWNRRMRTSMYGGVGRVVGNGHPYTIYAGLTSLVH